VPLGLRAIDVLMALVEHPGELLTKQELMNAAWPGLTVEDSNLAVQVSTLRRILDSDRLEGSSIQTVIGRGYRFLPEVTSVATVEPRVTSATASPSAALDSRPRLSLVVLPFRNLSRDPAGDTLAESITDELTADLSGWSSAFVVNGKSAETHGADLLDGRWAGLETGARYAIRGSVGGISDHPRVNVQLIDADTGACLWAERFDADRGSGADVYDEITGRLARGLIRKLIDNVNRRIEALPPRDWTTEDLIVRGRAFTTRQISVAHRESAMCCFEQALARDSDSIGAKVGISGVLISNILDGWSRSIEEDEARVERLLLEVLQADTDIPRAHAYMGMLRRWQGRLSDSRFELETAIAMAPNFVLAVGQLGLTLIWLGHPEAAIPWLKKSIRLAPHDQRTPVDYSALGLCHLILGNVDDAVTCLRNARAGNPRLYYIHFWLAAGLGLREEIEEAGAVLRQGIALNPELVSLAEVRALWAMQTNTQFREQCENSIIAGLQRAGLPDRRVGAGINYGL
jgi:TolB-like protein